MNHQILLIDGPDRAGLIHSVTGLLFSYGANIVANDEFVDPRTHHFYMRTAFVGTLPEEELMQQLNLEIGQEATIRLVKSEPKKVIIMVTKEHHCLSDLLARNHFGEHNMEIKAVISNHDILSAYVEPFNIPFHIVSHKEKSRARHEKEIRDILSKYDFDYLVLAKYMRILNPEFVDQYPFQIINIHHSFLPAFIGASPYRQAYDRGVKIIGATAHFVTSSLDEGPIISQDVISVNHQMNVRDMTQAGRDVEKIVLARALKLIFEDRVFVYGNKTIIF